MMKITVLVLALLSLALAAVYFCSFTVSVKEYAIVTEFGKTVDTIDEAGLRFKLPYQSVIRIDRRHNVMTSQPIELLLKDKNPIVVVCYVCWRVAAPDLFLKSLVTSENAKLKLSDMLNSQLGSVLGDYSLRNVINTEPGMVKITEIEEKILANLNGMAGDKYGLEVVRTGIRRLEYPEIVENAVFNRMRAEREKEAKKYRAEGKQEAAKIEAQTDREVKEIMAEAYRKSQITKGEGDRESTRIFAEAYGRDREFFEFLKSLELYSETLQENTTLILSTDSPLFRYLNGADVDETTAGKQKSGKAAGDGN
jgi:modulator of FtsH protease HflC